MSTEDYTILGILGNSINCTTYKVKHKESKNVYVWQTIEYQNDDINKDILLDKLKKRIDISHPNIIKFFNYIHEENNKILYTTEYCRNGSLKDIIDTCIINGTHLSEEFVCKILYQIAFAIKTVNGYIGKLTTKEIFLDEDYNIKLYNFDVHQKTDMFKVTKMWHLGLTMYEVCTFKPFNKSKYQEEFKIVEGIYSQNLLLLIICLIKDKTHLGKNINMLLCHPSILLKSMHWVKEKNFIDIKKTEKIITSNEDNDKFDDKSSEYLLKLEKLKIRETALHIKEEQLNEREYQLKMKERRVTLMETTVKEKLQRAELYLNRCKESKSVNSESTKSSASLKVTEIHKQKSYENLDSTYVSCGDSILLPTSSKLNVNKIIKPAPFTRTLSERRIRFKGHSPLKEIDYNKRRSMRSKMQNKILIRNKSDWFTCSEETDKSSTDVSTRGDKAKQLFPPKATYENDITNNDIQCTPITWTEENKKYAFELLRVMKNDKENHCLEKVKHTYL